MPIEETGSYVGQLSATVSSNKPTDNPGKRADGAGEIRKLKAILKTSFPNIASAVSVSQTEINHLSGVTKNLQAQINERFRTGEMLVCHSNAAPLGWVKRTDPGYNDRMLRIVTGSVSYGGAHSPTIMNVVPAHNHTYSGATAVGNLNHVHGSNLWQYVPGSGTVVLTRNSGNQDRAGDTSGQSSDHVHSYSGTVAPNPGATNWQPRYLDFIIIQKS